MREDAVTFDQAAALLRDAIGARAPRPLEAAGFRRAAVLVPVVRRPDGAALLFTRRTESVRTHKGQISFPGGRCEEGEDAVAAALRETREEIGLAPDLVRPIGALDDHFSVSRYLVTPVVGLVPDPPAELRPHEGEVDEVMEVPIARLIDPAIRRDEWWTPAGMPPDAPLVELGRLAIASGDFDPETARYRVTFYAVGPDRVIWGLTARILNDLVARAFGPGAG